MLTKAEINEVRKAYKAKTITAEGAGVSWNCLGPDYDKG